MNGTIHLSITYEILTDNRYLSEEEIVEALSNEFPGRHFSVKEEFRKFDKPVEKGPVDPHYPWYRSFNHDRRDPFLATMHVEITYGMQSGDKPLTEEEAQDALRSLPRFAGIPLSVLEVPLEEGKCDT